MNLEKIGKDLKKAREEKRLTQTELAKKVGLHFNSYAKIERGELQPSLKTLEKIYKALGLRFPFT